MANTNERERKSAAKRPAKSNKTKTLTTSTFTAWNVYFESGMTERAISVGADSAANSEPTNLDGRMPFRFVQ